MFVSNTDTTTSLSNETSLITSLTALSNSSTSPRTLQKKINTQLNYEQQIRQRPKIIQDMEIEVTECNLLLMCPTCQSASRKTLQKITKFTTY